MSARRAFLVAAVLAAVLEAAALPSLAADSDVGSLRNRAAALLDNGEDARAIELFRDLMKRAPSSVPDRVNLAIALLNHNDLDGAEAELRKSLEIDAKDLRARYNLGVVLKRRGKNEEAAEALAAVAASPEGQKEAAAQYNLGIVYKRLRKADEALAAFRRAVALRPEHASAHFQIYNEMIQRGDKAGAARELELFKLLQKATPDFQRMEAYLERGRFTEIAAPGPRPAGSGGTGAREMATPGGTVGIAEIRFEVSPSRSGGRAGSGAAKGSAEKAPEGRAGAVAGEGVLSDLDHDGKLDLVFATLAGTVRILRPATAGGSGAAPAILELAAGWGQGAAGGSGKAAPGEPGSGSDTPGGNGVIGGNAVSGGNAGPLDRGEITLAAGDVDNDGDPDLFAGSSGAARLYLNQGKSGFIDATKGSGLETAVGATGALWMDVDRDGDLDLVLGGSGGSGGSGEGSGGSNSGGTEPRILLNASVYPSPAAAAPKPSPEATAGRKEAAKAYEKGAAPGSSGVPRFIKGGTEAVLPQRGERVAFADISGRDDLDIAFASADGSLSLARNRRAGRFTTEVISSSTPGKHDDSASAPGEGHASTDTAGAPASAAGDSAGRMAAAQAEVRSGDLDGDGFIDLVSLLRGSIFVLWNDGEGALAPPALLASGLPADCAGLALIDADGDGDLDVATIGAAVSGAAASGAATSGPTAAGTATAGATTARPTATGPTAAGATPAGTGAAGARVLGAIAGLGSSAKRLLVLRNDGARRFTPLSEAGPELPSGGGSLLAGDLDGDGDPDLVALIPGAESPIVLLNATKSPNRFVKIVLTGTKSNRSGVGAKVEVRAERLVVKRECDGNPVLIGIGTHTRADSVRVVWPTGVTQDLIDVAAGVAKLDEKREFAGSCPFLYAWDGGTFRFVGEALSGAPVGFLRPDGTYERPRPVEHLRLPPGLPVERGGRLSLRLTEEMRELTALDRVRLVAVDHPAGVEVYSNERLRETSDEPFRFLAIEGLRGPSAAAEDTGRLWETASKRFGARGNVDGSSSPVARRSAGHTSRVGRGGSEEGLVGTLSQLDGVAASGFATLGPRLEGLAEPHELVLRFEASAPHQNAEDGGAEERSAAQEDARASTSRASGDKADATGDATLALVLDGWVSWTTSDVSRALLQYREAGKYLAADPLATGSMTFDITRISETQRAPRSGPASSTRRRSRTFAGVPIPDSPEPWGPALEVRTGRRLVFEPDLGLPIGPVMVVPLPQDVTGEALEGTAAAQARGKVHVEAPATLAGEAVEVRIGSGLAVYYDRIRLGRVVNVPLTIRELPLAAADLRWRGVAAARRQADAIPPRPDYDDVSPMSPFARLPGETSSPGDVLPLVLEADGRLVVFGTGDELALDFDATAISPPAPGFERTWFLVSTGYARDGDPNTELLPWKTPGSRP